MRCYLFYKNEKMRGKKLHLATMNSNAPLNIVQMKTHVQWFCMNVFVFVTCIYFRLFLFNYLFLETLSSIPILLVGRVGVDCLLQVWYDQPIRLNLNILSWVSTYKDDYALLNNMLMLIPHTCTFIQLPMRSAMKSHYRPTTDPGASRPLWVSATSDAVENTPLCMYQRKR